MPKVSIVVPIYKVEKYLKECIDSIVNQTLRDIEIILVDDGSPDGCPAICEEYASKDNRIKVIHKENGGYGTACNRGIAEATGDYIGLVESDDWIEPTMYEKLYNQITKFDADVCISSFYEYKSKSTFANGLHNREYEDLINNIDENKSFSILEHPFLFTTHPSVWAKLYNSKFVKSIKFDETPKMSYQDGPFITEVFCKAKKIIGLKDYIYHYRVDNEEASSCNLNKSKNLYKVIDQWQIAKEILKKYNMYENLKEEFYFQATKSGLRFYRNIHSKYRQIFFNKWKNFTAELKNDKSFKYIYFNTSKKNFYKSLFNNDIRASLFDEYNAVKLLGIPILEKTIRNGKSKTRILGFPISTKYRCRGYSIKKLFCGLFKIKENNQYKKFYLLGVQLYCKTKTDNFEKYYYLQKTNIQASIIHPKTFLKYKNFYNNKEIAIVGCGPSLKYYNNILPIPHIGVNRAFLNENIPFKYLFIQDFLIGKDYMQLANNYRKEDCIKFYGIIPELRSKKLRKDIRCLSNQQICNANANTYILEDDVCRNIAQHLECEAIGDWKGCVFSALQFALYTNPSKIYLIGCDCSSSGHFHNEIKDNLNDLTYQLSSWQNFKIFINKMYPDTEVISVNPIGLKGLFKDIYTDKLQNRK